MRNSSITRRIDRLTGRMAALTDDQPVTLAIRWVDYNTGSITGFTPSGPVTSCDYRNLLEGMPVCEPTE